MKKFGFAFWQSQRDALERMYFSERKSTREISQLYGVYPETIANNMRKLGFKLRQVGSDDRPNAIYQVDSNFFDEIDSEEKAYTLGFVIADGHVSKQGSLMIGLNYQDVDIIEKIRKSMGSNHPIKVNEKKKNASISIASKPIVTR